MATRTNRRRSTPAASVAAAKPATAKQRAAGLSSRPGQTLIRTTLQTRMTEEQKRVIQEAAEQRQIAVSEYVRLTVFEQAKRELEAAAQRVYALTADEQAALWRVLHAPVELTKAQKRLSRLMRGQE